MHPGKTTDISSAVCWEVNSEIPKDERVVVLLLLPNLKVFETFHSVKVNDQPSCATHSPYLILNFYKRFRKAQNFHERYSKSVLN